MPRLQQWAEQGWTAEAGLAFFDSLPAVRPDDMTGEWRGTELPSGHPLDGLLAAYGWYGKRFSDKDRVDPLLFMDAGQVRAVDPARLPLGLALALPRIARASAARGLFRLLLPVLATDRPGARLRSMEHRGLISAAMIYDAQPIIDHFRRVDEDRLLGLMDLRPTPAPFFFLLTRTTASGRSAAS